MPNQFDCLLAQLDEEEAAYQGLLACTRKEKQAIVGLDAESLTRIGRRKAETALRLRKLAGERGHALQAVGEKIGLPAEELTLRRLSKAAPPPYDEKLRRRRCRLSDLARMLGEENDHVRRLATHGLSLVRGSHQLIVQLLDESPVYRPSGDLQPAAATGKLHQSDF